MKKKIMFVTLIIIIIYNLYQYICLTPTIIIKESNNPGPVILFISGVHGNEIAGNYAITEFFKNNKINRGTAILIPKANYCSFLLNRRGLIGTNNDLNRQFNSKDNNLLNDNIEELVLNCDMVIDFHESINYYLVNNKNYGNTIATNSMYDDAKNCINKLNKINDSPQWSVIKPIKESSWKKGTLFNYCNKNNIKYMLVETNVKEDLKKRIFQCNIVLNCIYSKYLK